MLKEEYKSHRTMLKAAMPSAPRKKQFKATAPQNWAVNVDEVLEHVPTPEQEGWVQERRLMLDSTDGAIMRLVHVGWHEDQECVVFWYYEMGASDTRMPRAGPNKLDMERCDFCTHDDAVEMMRDFQEWKEKSKLKFEPES
jgi:hypothetical protein